MKRDSGRFGFETGGGFAAILLWSTTFALARSLSEQVGPLTAGAAVYLIAGVFCLLRLRWSRIPISSLLSLPRRYLVGCGLLFVLYTGLLYGAVGLTQDRQQLLEIALVNYLWPSATIVLSLSLLGRQATVWLLPGTGLALWGLLLVMTQGSPVSLSSFREHFQTNPIAYLLALVAAISWALYSNLARRWSEPGQRGAVELFVPATGIVLLVLRLLTSETTLWTTKSVVESVVFGGMTALAYGLWDLAMRKGRLLLVVACSYFTPLLSTLVSCAYLRVTPSPKLWLGCGLLVAGSLLSWVSVSEPRPREMAAVELPNA